MRGINICELQEKRLITRLRSLKVKGEVIEKRRVNSCGGQPERKIVLVKFKNRIIETHLDDLQFERLEIGEQIRFSPPVPECDPCICHLFVWLVVGLMAGALAIWAITNHFQGRTATLLFLSTAGCIGAIAWARISLHGQNKYHRDLELEIDFFDTEGGYGQGGQ